MKREALRVTSTIPVAPTTLYFAWIDSDHHSSMTGSTAKIDPTVGAKYSALDGYITGKLVILDLGRRIVMSWRTTDFPREAVDSRVEVHFETLGASTRILILHTEIPEGQAEKYKALWNEKYITPMRAYFSKFLPDPRNPPVRRPPPPPPESDDDDDDEEVPVKGKGRFGAKAPPGKPSAPVKASPAASAKPSPSNGGGPGVHKAETKAAAPPKPAAKVVPPAKAPAKATPAPAKPAPAKQVVAKAAPAKKVVAKPAKPAKPAKAKAKAKKPAPKKPAPKKPAPKAKKPAAKAKKPAAKKPAPKKPAPKAKKKR